MQKKRLEEALNAGKLIKLGFNLNFAKPERLNLLYSVRCFNNKVVYANGEIKLQDNKAESDLEDGGDQAAENKPQKSEKDEEKVEILCLQFNQNSNLLATGNSNGHIQIHDIFSGLPVGAEESYESSDTKLLSFITKSVPRSVLNVSKSVTYNMPIISMKWFPYNNYSTNLLFYAHVNGYVGVLDRLSMKKIIAIEETDEIASMDFNIEGSYLAVVGKDYTIKLYDTHLNRSSFNKMVKSYGCHNKCHNTTGNHAQILHTNRLQSVKFSNMSNDVLFTGGWDRTVKVWDKRTSNGLVNTIHGPFICGGDGIDVCNYLVLTASWVKENALQLWDIRNCNKVLAQLPVLSEREAMQRGDTTSIGSLGSLGSIGSNSSGESVESLSDPRKKGEYLYACKFFSSNNQHQSYAVKEAYPTMMKTDSYSTVIACGSGTQSVHLIDYEETELNRHVAAINCKSPLYCLDTMYASSLIACGSMKKLITLMTTTASATPSTSSAKSN